MNQKERNVLVVVSEAIGCPFPGSGVQTSTVGGLAEYVSDMRRVVPAARHLITTLCGGESYPGELDDDVEALESEITWR